MAITDSRVRQGVLTLDGVDFSCQPTSVAIVPSNSAGGAGNTLEVLCGDTLSESGTAEEFSADLTITAIQDFTNAAGVVAFSWTHNAVTVPFEWQPTNQVADRWAGRVKVTALDVGGEVAERNTSQAQWPISELFMPARLGGLQVIPNQVGTVAITGVTAGSPGAFQPGDATLPSSLAALKVNSVVGDDGTNKPSAMWSSGQYVVLADASEAYWTGIAWTEGRHS